MLLLFYGKGCLGGERAVCDNMREIFDDKASYSAYGQTNRLFLRHRKKRFLKKIGRPVDLVVKTTSLHLIKAAEGEINAGTSNSY